MENILLSKSNETNGMDLAIGEATVVRNTLFNYIRYKSILNTSETTHDHLEYLPPNGYQPLVKFLEDKHGAPVIITNGAKQALAATCYLLKKRGIKTIGMRKPWWALLPTLIKSFDLKWMDEYVGADACLAVLPNNPDGFVLSSKEIEEFVARCKDNKQPLIHDAVYYSHIYLPKEFELQPFGDLQIFSASKYLGLSGIRLGYIVCRNTEYFYDLCEYLEMMTVGVSVLSQQVILNIFDKFKSKPYLQILFENECRSILQKNKEIFSKTKPEVVELPKDFINSNGMFAFVKINDMQPFIKNNIKIIDGSGFGAPGMARINLAVPSKILEDVVVKLNGN